MRCVSPRRRRKPSGPQRQLSLQRPSKLLPSVPEAAARTCRQREAEERAAREALLEAQENRAATVKAVDLDGRIASAEEALNKLE